MSESVNIDKATAERLLESSAFHIPVETVACPECTHEFPAPDQRSDAGRTLIHSWRGGFGADWDLDDALEVLAASKHQMLQRALFGWVVALDEPDGRMVRFDVNEHLATAVIERTQS